MASVVFQRTYWPVPPDCPDGQHCQVLNYDVSDWCNLVRNIIGVNGTAKYGERS